MDYQHGGFSGVRYGISMGIGITFVLYMQNSFVKGQELFNIILCLDQKHIYTPKHNPRNTQSIHIRIQHQLPILHPPIYLSIQPPLIHRRPTPHPARPLLHLHPTPIRLPNPRSRIIPVSTALHIPKAKILRLREPRLPFPCPGPPQAVPLINVSPKALYVVDEDAESVIREGREVPVEGDIGGCEAEGDEGFKRGGESRVVRRVALEGCGGLEDGVEAPAGDAVDEEAY